ncbi:Fur family transcriptional regulator [Streptomyces sp. TRM64462]|uniref:Fur family transcriptional regulator n=1 Tax=Streptomyces sp. TRM64462 TaxID=2741726 RepID=UPI001C308AA1|nr:Fur family transcriptional regulator [Streptomyces sp. TRM64462]
MTDATRQRVGARSTQKRADVLQALDACQDFVSAQQLYTRMTASGLQVGLSTVYRTLQALDRGGRLDTVRDTDGERLYRWRSPSGHRHYLICRRCSRSQAVDTDAVELWVEHISATSGFADVEHTLELSGLCPDCHPPAR